MENKGFAAYSSFSLSTLLTVAFVVLKLCGVINWSWLWVFSPLWIPAALILVFILIILVIRVLGAIFK